MSRRWRRYKNTGYRPYYNRNRPNLFEMLIIMLIETCFRLGFLLGKLIFKLIQKSFQGNTGTKGFFKINDASPILTTINNTSPVRTSISEVSAIPPEEIDKRYGLKQSLLTPAEKNFLSVLEQVVGDRYRIENQVQLSRIVTPLDSNANFTNYRDFNQIKAKSIDFVLYDKSYKPYLCIELDDRSHLRWKTIKRDAFVDGVMKDVGLRIIHIPASYSYNSENLSRQIFQGSIAE